MAKRELTAEELRMAARMKSIIARRDDLTEESVGTFVGVSQGQVSHWTGGRLPVPAGRAAKFAQALGIDDPGEISVAYREARIGRIATHDLVSVASPATPQAMAFYGVADLLAPLRRAVAAVNPTIQAAAINTLPLYLRAEPEEAEPLAVALVGWLDAPPARSKKADFYGFLEALDVGTRTFILRRVVGFDSLRCVAAPNLAFTDVIALLEHRVHVEGLCTYDAREQPLQMTVEKITDAPPTSGVWKDGDIKRAFLF